MSLNETKPLRGSYTYPCGVGNRIIIIMRKITKQSVDAFLNAQNFKSSNTAVIVCQPNQEGRGIVRLELHGNMIADRLQGSTVMYICNCGWFTNTTKERLNALPNVNIIQKAGVWYLNGEQWDGKIKAIEIK